MIEKTKKIERSDFLAKSLENELDYRASSYELLINEVELKKTYHDRLSTNEEQTLEELPDYNGINLSMSYLIMNEYCSLSEVNNILSENMKYNCSNIFLEKLPHDLSDIQIEQGFESINTLYNSNYMAIDYHSYLNTKDFNLIDRVTPNRNANIFFPILKYDSNKIEIFCFVSFLDKKLDKRLRMCCVEIDRKTNSTTFFVNGATGSLKIINDHNNEISSPNSFFKYVKNTIEKLFKIQFNERTNKKLIEDRERMFEFCNDMNNIMIGDISEELFEELTLLIDGQISRTFGRMTKINNKVKSNPIVKKKLNDKIFSAYLGEFITMGFNETELKQKARLVKAPCYPTKISFKGHELARGKAMTRGKEFPLTFETIFYSINTDLSLAGELEEFTVAWFDSDYFEDSHELETSQTSIKIKKDYFSITMGNRIYKNKGLTKFVLSTIRDQLEKRS